MGCNPKIETLLLLFFFFLLLLPRSPRGIFYSTSSGRRRYNKYPANGRAAADNWTGGRHASTTATGIYRADRARTPVQLVRKNRAVSTGDARPFFPYCAFGTQPLFYVRSPRATASRQERRDAIGTHARPACPPKSVRAYTRIFRQIQ